MGNGVVRTYEFIRHMESQTQSDCWSAKCVGVSFQKEPTQLYQEVVFPERRSSPFSITLLKAVGNGGYADLWVQVEMLLVA